MPPFFILWRKKISGFYQMGLHPGYRKDPYERKRKNIAALLMNYACIKLIDASVLLYFSFDSSFSQSRSMGQAVPTVHLTFYRLSAVIRDMSDIHRYSDHTLFSSQPLYTQ